MSALLATLKESSREAVRNTRKCYEVAKRPGYPEYYQPPEDVVAAVRNNDLKKMTKKVDRVQSELDSLDAEINAVAASSIAVPSTDGLQISSLQQVGDAEGPSKTSDKKKPIVTVKSIHFLPFLSAVCVRASG